MMRLKDLIDEIDRMRPTALGNNEKLEYINAGIRRFGAEIGKSDMQSFETLKGMSLYPLPEGILPEFIKAVVVDGKLCKAVLYEEDMGDNSFMLEPYGFILLSGKKGGRSVEILYNSCNVFEGFSEESGSEKDFLEQDCGVHDSYAQILVFYALCLISEAEEDIKAAANYKAHCDEILRHARQDRYEKRGKYPTVKGAWKWQRF